MQAKTFLARAGKANLLFDNPVVIEMACLPRTRCASKGKWIVTRRRFPSLALQACGSDLRQGESTKVSRSMAVMGTLRGMNQEMAKTQGDESRDLFVNTCIQSTCDETS